MSEPTSITKLREVQTAAFNRSDWKRVHAANTKIVREWERLRNRALAKAKKSR